ncbi:hypothetical protein [Bradyrhizobium sp. RD5-C2]|uniref:hypothetical protein n=1 Tax=Bradyrhizobium sp. RD5-C2 TaxID=244562 RepID=UPI001CC4038A|nr:hypothetical protein [Bradyrhizobium sp. RD5-C2]
MSEIDEIENREGCDGEAKTDHQNIANRRAAFGPTGFYGGLHDLSILYFSHFPSFETFSDPNLRNPFVPNGDRLIVSDRARLRMKRWPGERATAELSGSKTTISTLCLDFRLATSATPRR